MASMISSLSTYVASWVLPDHSKKLKMAIINGEIADIKANYPSFGTPTIEGKSLLTIAIEEGLANRKEVIRTLLQLGVKVDVNEGERPYLHVAADRIPKWEKVEANSLLPELKYESQDPNHWTEEDLVAALEVFNEFGHERNPSAFIQTPGNQPNKSMSLAARSSMIYWEKVYRYQLQMMTNPCEYLNTPEGTVSLMNFVYTHGLIKKLDGLDEFFTFLIDRGCSAAFILERFVKYGDFLFETETIIEFAKLLIKHEITIDEVLEKSILESSVQNEKWTLDLYKFLLQLPSVKRWVQGNDAPWDPAFFFVGMKPRLLVRRGEVPKELLEYPTYSDETANA